MDEAANGCDLHIIDDTVDRRPDFCAVNPARGSFERLLIHCNLGRNLAALVESFLLELEPGFGCLCLRFGNGCLRTRRSLLRGGKAPLDIGDFALC